jgi:methylamine utilization protein MauE
MTDGAGMLFDLAPAVAALLLGGLLGWSGAGKLADRALAERAAGTALTRLLGDPGRAAAALRLVGAAEASLAAGLLLGPAAGATAGAAAGLGTAALGTGFLGYLAWARVTDPGSSCGCTAARNEPITWRAFARAGLVVAGGLVVTGGLVVAGGAATGRPWWSVVAAQPAAAAGALAAGVAVLAGLSAGLDHRWLLPLRQARIRLFGHPLAGTAGPVPLAGRGGPVPLAATVDLLVRSRAWEAAAGVVRSGLVEHWDADGWRVLRYTGVSAGRPVSVLFALDATATAAGPAGPAVRVSVVAEDTAEILALAPA